MKNLLYSFLPVALLVYLLSIQTALAVEVTELKPSQNVGVFEQSDNVIFDASFSAEKEDYVRFEIVDIDNNLIEKKEVIVSDGESTKLDFGKFEPGWYRVYAYNFDDDKIYSTYTAFVVTENYSSRMQTENSPFAADMALVYGGYSPMSEEYAEAYKLAGINMVRERNSYLSTVTIDGVKEAYKKNGISMLSVWSKPSVYYAWTGNLFDIYNFQKQAAFDYSDSVTAWEIINEPDLVCDTADVYSAYLKAGAIGAYDGNNNAKKSFGGMCAFDDGFRTLTCQNGVLDYLDSYNVHTHRGIGTRYTPIQTLIINAARYESTVYGGGKQVWVTESGLRMMVDENELPSEGMLTAQARYAITSCVESLALCGTDKHFWFLGRHLIENGFEYGSFSKNNMPYPAVSALSTLTYHLKEANYLGNLQGLTKDTNGFLFDTGNGQAVVLYKRSEGETSVQIDTKKDAKIVDLTGKCKTRIVHSYHNKVNIPVTYNPVIVVLGDEEPIARYCKKSFNHNTEPETISDAERIVIQPIWDSAVQTDNGAYVVERGSDYDINVRVYNFSDSSKNVTLDFNTSGKVSVSETSKVLRISAKNYVDVSVTLSVENDAMPMSQGYFKVSGQLKGGEKISQSVGKYVVSSAEIENFIEVKNKFLDFENTDNWRVVSSGRCNKSSNGNSISFDTTFNGTEKYTFPRYTVSEDLSEYDGIYVEIKNDSELETTFYAYIDDVVISLGTFGTGSKKYFLPWKSGMDSSSIKEISIGFSRYAEESEVKYTIVDFGYFKFADSSTKNVCSMKINGISDNTVMKICPSNISAKYEGNLTNIEVYLDYKKYDNFEINEEEKIITINFKDIDNGEKTLIVTGEDEFNREISDCVNFCIEE